jgi:hypothetical protein
VPSSKTTGSKKSPPSLEWLFEISVTMGERLAVGPSYGGERFLIPLTGGHFKGPKLKGRVMPGGIDRQLSRPDGVLEMDARYELESHDGIILTVYDYVLQVKDPKAKTLRALTQPKIIAPSGKYEWLNALTLVGSLESSAMGADIVSVQIYSVNLAKA